jgi:broad specificity phosphatase PhoE
MTERLADPGPGQHRPADTCTVYLVRHGITKLHRYRGRRDVPLDTQGYQDATEAAGRLADVGLSAVYAGPLRRTIATAQIIAEKADVPDVRILNGLNNLDYGAWEGMTAEEADMFAPEAFARYRSAPADAVCPAGERLSDAQHRISAALQLIGSRHAGQVVAAVTHAVMIRLFLMELNHIEDDTWRLPLRQGLVTEVWLRDGTITLALPASDSTPDAEGEPG